MPVLCVLVVGFVLGLVFDLVFVFGLVFDVV